MMSGPLFYELAGCIVYIAFILFALDQSMKEMNFDTLLTIDCLMTTNFLNFILCHFSEELTQRSFDVADIIFKSKWYKLSIKQQQLLVMPIHRSQKEFRLKGHKIIECSMETFLTVYMCSMLGPMSISEKYFFHNFISILDNSCVGFVLPRFASITWIELNNCHAGMFHTLVTRSNSEICGNRQMVFLFQ